MFRLGELKAAKGSHRNNKRLGRGAGSGKGDTSGKGHKGLLARKGGGRRVGYEGGQTPMIRRIPKRGFHNFFRKDFLIVNLSQIEKSGLKDVTLDALKAAGILKGSQTLLKVLGIGELKRSVTTIKADKISESAKQKLEKAGVKIEVVDVRG